jgi:Icc-related predicted phosphoesterase
MPTENGTVRLAAMADVHCGKGSHGALHTVFAKAAREADVLVLGGDLTDYGLPDEARVLVGELGPVLKAQVPVVAVLGNHDYESGHPDEVRKILCDAGVSMLDGESCEVHGVGFAGVKGFCGGFGRATLGAWGEPGVKRFVQDALDETLKLETALARLRTPRRIALLHYAPIRATVEGEPVEIFPWLGCGRLEEPLTRYPVHAVFHGHAHNGAFQGRARGDIPVYNVAMPLLLKTFPDRPPFFVLEVALGGAEGVTAEDRGPGAGSGARPGA